MPIDTKTSLLNAAEQAARQHGFDGFSYGDLATQVGIRKASIHHHFPAKADLAVALMARYSDTVKEACAQIDATAQTGAERLTQFIAFYRESMGEGSRLCLCVALSTNPHSLPDACVLQIAQFREMATAWLTEVFRAGRRDESIRGVGEESSEAIATLALLEGAQLGARGGGNPAIFDRAVVGLEARLHESA